MEGVLPGGLRLEGLLSGTRGMTTLAIVAPGGMTGEGRDVKRGRARLSGRVAEGAATATGWRAGAGAVDQGRRGQGQGLLRCPSRVRREAAGGQPGRSRTRRRGPGPPR